VEGTYEMSRKEVGSLFCWAVIFIAPFSVVAGKSWSNFARTTSLEDAALAAFCLMAIALVALWIVPRAFVKYELRDGHISRVSSDGKVRWRENLSGVPRVVLCNDRLNTFLTLRWAERRRSFLVPDSLAEAIDAVQRTSNTTREHPPRAARPLGRLKSLRTYVIEAILVLAPLAATLTAFNFVWTTPGEAQLGSLAVTAIPIAIIGFPLDYCGATTATAAMNFLLPISDKLAPAESWRGAVEMTGFGIGALVNVMFVVRIFGFRKVVATTGVVTVLQVLTLSFGWPYGN